MINSCLDQIMWSWMCLMTAMNDNTLQQVLDVQLSSKMVTGNLGKTEK